MKDAEGNAHAEPEEDEALGGEQGSRGGRGGEEPAGDGLAADGPGHRGAQNGGVDRGGEDEHEVAGVVPDHARQPPRPALRGRKPRGIPTFTAGVGVRSGPQAPWGVDAKGVPHITAAISPQRVEPLVSGLMAAPLGTCVVTYRRRRTLKRSRSVRDALPAASRITSRAW
jgi:hypothetical protein